MNVNQNFFFASLTTSLRYPTIWLAESTGIFTCLHVFQISQVVVKANVEDNFLVIFSITVIIINHITVSNIMGYSFILAQSFSVHLQFNKQIFLE